MGLNLGSDGYVAVDELLAHPSIVHQGYTLDDVQNVVRDNDKQRFNLIQRRSHWYIRANQGHSFPVPDLDLTPITEAEAYSTVIHGTYFNCLQPILRDGLSKMGRTHIHMTTGEFGSRDVISGMRRSAEVLIYIDLEKALQAGLKFYVSANGVILTPGDANGYLKPTYFKQVVRADNHQDITS
jgi:2'-phosphotransferase